ncbi:MAG: hypothetical protein A2X18_01130 [Bacteroidetes bacterium GWF2_40_14]|nr:MAG: hypothetical protein A2X18_01130 [Bacteroidetes bacterium GWF2_40_14]
MKNINISKKTIVVFLVIQVAIALLAFILFGLIPAHSEAGKISAIAELKSGGTDKELPKETLNLIKEVRASEHHEAYLRSTLKLSRTDSIALFIDLNDSLAFLSLKGVYLFQSKISKIKINKGLKKLPYFLRDSLYSGPIQVIEEISSIEKFPIVVKKAPKDTAEANQSAPALPIQNDVYVMFSFSNNMVIEIDQEEDELAGTRRAYRQYKRQYRRWFLSENISALFDPDRSGYIYHITIELPREDARSIYRALPLKPFVVVRY